MNKSHLCLTEDLVLAALKFGKLQTYSDKEMVHARGDKSVGLSIVETGLIKFGNYGLDGKYYLTRMMSRGETFGEFTLFANLPRTHTAESYGESRVLHLTESGFKKLCQAEPDFQTQLMSLLAIKLHTCLEVLDDITRLSLPVRLAKLLLNVLQQNNEINIPNRVLLTQSDLAALLGVTVLSTHKALKKLAEVQLITINYGNITINNITQLIAWVETHSSIQKLT
jgi:CRP-like cAMP-binding protein